MSNQPEQLTGPFTNCFGPIHIYLNCDPQLDQPVNQPA